MLLERVIEKNPGIVEAAVTLHQRGDLPAGSWLFDLDAVARNARLIAAEAKRLGLTTYLMTKQIGRNPFVTALALHMGLDKTVSVDIQCARLLHRYGLPIGHVGHLNQIPMHDIPAALAMSPEVVTVYSLEHARRISAAAGAIGRRQDLLMQVYAPEDIFFPGQEGGFRVDEALAAAREIAALPHVRIGGVTSFPVLDYDFSGQREVAFNPNMATIRGFAQLLRDELGLEITQINAPGNTSVSTLALLREGGATHVEPGHGLFGTTPPQIVDGGHVETPAYVFVTEVSHQYEGKAYAIANGGLWAMQGKFLPAWPIGALVDPGLDGRRPSRFGGGARESHGLRAHRPDHRLPHPAAPRKPGEIRRHGRLPDVHPGAHDARAGGAGQRNLHRRPAGVGRLRQRRDDARRRLEPGRPGAGAAAHRRDAGDLPGILTPGLRRRQGRSGWSAPVSSRRGRRFTVCGRG